MKLSKTEIYILVAVLVLIVLGFMAYRFGWFDRNKDLRLKDGEGEVDKKPSGATDMTRYNSLARTTHDSLVGANYQSSYFYNIAQSLLALNKNELRLVNNAYNDMYRNDPEYNTLRAAINGEWQGYGFGLFQCTSGQLSDPNHNCYLQATLLQRLNQIGA